MSRNVLQKQILKWYDQNQRILPWRDNNDPFRVWISEIMLQQTKVSTVIPYFDRFIKNIPDVHSLSVADDDYLNKLWEGLGYYSRVRNLKNAAIIVVEKYGGIIPSTYNQLVDLPGIGDYTAGALLSIAFNKPYTAVDGNVLRVFARIKRIKENIKDPKIKKNIKTYVESLLPTSRVGDFNQALMEIGATICLPSGKPLCQICPVKDHCQTFKYNETDIIPIKQKKKKVPIKKRTVFVLKQNNMYGILKRPNKGLLANMYEFHNVDKHLSIHDVKSLFNSKTVKKLSKSLHKFTHLWWDMIGYEVELDNYDDKFLWVTKTQIENDYSIPTAFKTYKKHIK